MQSIACFFCAPNCYVAKLPYCWAYAQTVVRGLNAVDCLPYELNSQIAMSYVAISPVTCDLEPVTWDPHELNSHEPRCYLACDL